MSYILMMAACAMCHTPFSFNPNRVPAVLVEGKKEPLCKTCHETANIIRKEQGLEPWPEPLSGAYEAAPEEEIIWD